MEGLSRTAYVILGMLRTRAHTGYEIKSLVDHSTRFFWAASYGQIYPELRRLEEAGLVEGEAEAHGGRRRRAFSLTDKGREALEAWIKSGGPLHIEMRHEGLLRFFFADVVEPEAQLDLVREHARAARAHAGGDGRRPSQGARRLGRSAASASRS